MFTLTIISTVAIISWIAIIVIPKATEKLKNKGLSFLTLPLKYQFLFIIGIAIIVGLIFGLGLAFFSGAVFICTLIFGFDFQIEIGVILFAVYIITSIGMHV